MTGNLNFFKWQKHNAQKQAKNYLSTSNAEKNLTETPPGK